jgi:hypothetical protein
MTNGNAVRTCLVPMLAGAQGLEILQLQRIPRTDRLLHTTSFTYNHTME